MSIITKVIGENDNSDEYLAAVRFEEIIRNTAPSTAMGEIIIYPKAELYGQETKDVDIIVIGHMTNALFTAEFDHGNDAGISEDQVFFESFCTTIEVKSHSVNGVKREGTNWYVKYGLKWHNASDQSFKQKNSAMNYFMYHLGNSPYITNVIWFTEITRNELSSFNKFGGKEMLSNVLTSDCQFADFLRLLSLQRKPWQRNGRYYFECGFGGNDADYYKRPLDFFAKAKEGMGELTRKKIEQITQKNIEEQELDVVDNKMLLLRGRAGTGKTVGLLRLAIKLSDERDSRVQILTYNKALVADIRRLFALADVPDMFDWKCVGANTMHSYFYGVVKSCLYSDGLDGNDFLDNYGAYLREMIDFLKSDPDAKEMVRDMCQENAKLNWDYILIDEAQDWTKDEQDLIVLLHGKDHVIVADGGLQFVRNIDVCDWSLIPDRQNIKLKYCLRQKENIVKFINHYVQAIDASFNRIQTNNSMPGGNVIVVKSKDRLMETIKRERKKMIKAENVAYDMLFLAPPSMVEHDDGIKTFMYKTEYERNGILLWDGTTDDNRTEYAIDLEESRVIQYDSSRGLEGWTVCCLGFDSFLKYKEDIYKASDEGSSLLLESPEDIKKKYMLNWAMMPMTRAIDTLIIALEDENSSFSKMIIEMANEYTDYIELI